MSIPSVRSASSLHHVTGQTNVSNNELNEISHIEFSKLLNDSSSSSRSTSPTASTYQNGHGFKPPQMPMSSSPILNNNNHIEAILPPKLPPRKKVAGITAIQR